MATRSFSSEFPNDNSELHLGTIWMSESVCGPAEPHFAPMHEMEEEVGGDDAPIEIVESIVIEEPVEIVPLPVVPAPLESGVVASATSAEPATETWDAIGVPIQEETIDRPAPLESTAPPAPEDPYASLLQTLADVACAAGAMLDAQTIDDLLDGDPIAAAWSAILRGESEDFALCATPLDEWASATLAQLIASPHRAAQLRRELRARGIAAFGLIEAA